MRSLCFKTEFKIKTKTQFSAIQEFSRNIEIHEKQKSKRYKYCMCTWFKYAKRKLLNVLNWMFTIYNTPRLRPVLTPISSKNVIDDDSAVLVISCADFTEEFSIQEFKRFLMSLIFSVSIQQFQESQEFGCNARNIQRTQTFKNTWIFTDCKKKSKWHVI